MTGRCRHIAALAGLLAIAAAAPAAAAGEGSVSLAQTVSDEVACLQQIRNEERAHRIPRGLLTAIGLTESGRMVARGHRTVWPWTVNAAGEGHFFATKADAIAFVERKQGDGVDSIDVGCMQINLKHHPDAFASLDDAFDPATNVAYAADFLTGLRVELKSWIGAARRYHSATPALGEAYGERVLANWNGAAKTRALAEAAEGGAVQLAAADAAADTEPGAGTQPASATGIFGAMPRPPRGNGRFAAFAQFYGPLPAVPPAAASSAAGQAAKPASFRKVFIPRVTAGMTGLTLQDYRRR